MFRLVIFSCLFLATFVHSNQPNPAQGRIVGGSDTDISVVPHQVALRYDNKLVCGGSIVGPRHILTAAHCLKRRNPAFLTVRAGSNHYYRGGQKVDVARVIQHPHYNADTDDYDAAILVLKKDLSRNEKVQVAQLTNVEPQERDMILISGWGSMKKDGGMAELLQSASVPFVSKKACKQMYEDEDITDRMFCAGYLDGKKDACEGDSGGPATLNGKLVGIVSWGDDCGQKNSPGVYTSVVKISSWISEQVRLRT